MGPCQLQQNLQSQIEIGRENDKQGKGKEEKWGSSINFHTQVSLYHF
jgi:hypothetical protein